VQRSARALVEKKRSVRQGKGSKKELPKGMVGREAIKRKCARGGESVWWFECRCGGGGRNTKKEGRGAVLRNARVQSRMKKGNIVKNTTKRIECPSRRS